MNKKFVTLLVLSALTQIASAGPQTFDFKDPKGVNNATFKLDAPLEAIDGYANGISGTVTFDPENPGVTKGKIVVSAESLHVHNPLMKQHMHGEMWMDVAKHKEISFEAKELKNVKTSGDKISADAIGTFTMKGVAKEITIPVTLTYLKDKLGQRMNKPDLKGDLLVIRSTFDIKRSDFNINPKAPQEKVSDEITLSLSIAGAAAR